MDHLFGGQNRMPLLWMLAMAGMGGNITYLWLSTARIAPMHALFLLYLALTTPLLYFRGTRGKQAELRLANLQTAGALAGLLLAFILFAIA